jgi:hypothetical protein
MSLLPNRIFLIRHKRNYFGYTSDIQIHTCDLKTYTHDLQTNIFGFIKESDVDKVSKVIKFDTTTQKVDNYNYVISKKTKLKKPIDFRHFEIIESDPLVTAMEFALNNVTLDLIDEVTSNHQGLTLTSNYNLDIDLNSSFVIDKLNALYKNEPYDLSHYLERNGEDPYDFGAV